MGLTSIIKVYTDVRLELGILFRPPLDQVYEWVSFSLQKYINGVSFSPKKNMNGYNFRYGKYMNQNGSGFFLTSPSI